jgi:hypothetical protein
MDVEIAVISAPIMIETVSIEAPVACRSTRRSSVAPKEAPTEVSEVAAPSVGEVVEEVVKTGKSVSRRSSVAPKPVATPDIEEVVKTGKSVGRRSSMTPKPDVTEVATPGVEEVVEEVVKPCESISRRSSIPAKPVAIEENTTVLEKKVENKAGRSVNSRRSSVATSPVLGHVVAEVIESPLRSCSHNRNRVSSVAPETTTDVAPPIYQFGGNAPVSFAFSLASKTAAPIPNFEAPTKTQTESINKDAAVVNVDRTTETLRKSRAEASALKHADRLKAKRAEQVAASSMKAQLQKQRDEVHKKSEKGKKRVTKDWDAIHAKVRRGAVTFALVGSDSCE